MKALWLDRTGAAPDLRQCPPPEPRPGAVVVDVLAVRVPANVAEVLAGKPPYELPVPLIPGPACIGRVRSAGADVMDIAPGQIVLCNSLCSSGETGGGADEILIGWTGNGTERGRRMQALWRHGSFAEQALYPRDCAIPLPGAEGFDPAVLSFFSSIAIADAGLQRGGLEAGHCVLIGGATGQLGSAAVLAALARGAGRVVATGRNAARLERLAALSPRVAAVALTGVDEEADRGALRRAAGGGTDLVVDLAAHMDDPAPVMACIETLRPGGKAVLVGGRRGTLPLRYDWMMRNRIGLCGSFMFDRGTVDATWRLVAGGLLDLAPVRAQAFGLTQMAGAMETAARLGGLDIAVLLPNAPGG